MQDINGKEIRVGQILLDRDLREFEVIEKWDTLYAKSLFNDVGFGEYELYQARVNRNYFKIKE